MTDFPNSNLSDFVLTEHIIVINFQNSRCHGLHAKLYHCVPHGTTIHSFMNAIARIHVMPY